MKKETKDKVTNRDREFAVILEKVYSEIKVIGEDLTSVKARVEAIFEEQGKQKEELFIIKADIRIIKADIETMKVDIETMKVEIETVKIDLKLVKKDVAEIKEDFGKRLAHLEAIK